MSHPTDLNHAQRVLARHLQEVAGGQGMTPGAMLAMLRDTVGGPADLKARYGLDDAELDQLAEALVRADGFDLIEPDECTGGALPGEVGTCGRPRPCPDHDGASDLETAAMVGVAPFDPRGFRPAVDAVPEGPRAAYIRGFRELADWLERHPEVELPYLSRGGGISTQPTLDIFLVGDGQRERLATIARAMAAGGGRVRKHAEPDDSRFHLLRDFAGITLHAQAYRDEVCERVVVGTERVEVEVDACPECGGVLTTTDAGAAVCEVDPAHYWARKPGRRVETTERELVEWRCSPLLADEAPGRHPDLIGETDPERIKEIHDEVAADEQRRHDDIVAGRLSTEATSEQPGGER